MTPHPLTLAIVGGGALGAALVGALVDKLHPPLSARTAPRLVLFEKSARVGRGVAYAKDAASHLLNTTAQTMSLVPGRRSHFFEWLGERGLAPDEPGDHFCPRERFGDYVEDCFGRAVENARRRGVVAKNLGMSGWRLGYVLTHRRLADDILKVNQHLVTCMPTVLQMYCDTYFDDLTRCVAPQVRAVVEKRERLRATMGRLGLEAMAGASTFYFMVDPKRSGLGSEAYAERLLREHSIAVVPGRYYGASTDHFARIGIGTEPEPRIEAALARIRQTLG